MNDHVDPLEIELAALQPQPPSPALKERLADNLKGSVQLPSRPRAGRIWRNAAGIAGIVAVCLTAALLLRPGPAKKYQPKSSFAPVELPVAAAFDDRLPTVWSYRRALVRSEELDGLLNKHAGAARPNDGRTLTHLYIGLDTDQLFNGEL